MTTSDTPETDKATIASGGDWSPVLRETSRRLERERDEWAAMCGRYKQERDEARNKMADALQEIDLRMLDLERMKQKRNEAREKYDNLATEHMLVVNKICGERDEAREEHRKLKIILDVIKKETL